MIDRQQMREALTGPVTTLRTPFDSDGDIDFEALRRHVDFVIEAGSKAVVLTHGDSLYTLLTDREIAAVTKTVAEHAGRRAVVVAADNGWATPKAVNFGRYAAMCGTDCLMVMTPDWAHSGTEETFVNHYAAVAEEIPVMAVTNVFARRPEQFGIRVLEMAAERVANFVAVKDDICGTFARRMGLALYGEVALFAGGQKQNHMNQMPYGCDGYLSTFMTFKPGIAHRYWSAIEEDDLQAAVEIIETYDMPFFDFVGAMTGGFDAGLHGAIELFTGINRWRRAPYYDLNDEEMEQLAAFFTDLDLMQAPPTGP
ncbi:MAG: dihydrodipicolinate synthase family protein [Armatimonadota bacterium]